VKYFCIFSLVLGGMLVSLGSTAPSTIAATTTATVVAPTPTDPRVVAWIDPRNPLGSYPKNRLSLQLGQDSEGRNIERDITDFPDPGYRDPNTSVLTVVRTTDPETSLNSAFRHRIIHGMSYRQDRGYRSARASIMSTWGATSPFVLHDGVPYWAAFAIYVCKDHPFDGSGDHVSVLSLGHSVSSTNVQSMNKLDLRKDGKLRFWIQSNAVLDGTDVTRMGNVYDFPITNDVWNYIVIQWKYEWDVLAGPYTRLWSAVGDRSPNQMVDTAIPNSFRESAGYHPWKFGLYMWDVTSGWGSSQTRTIYTKGLYVFRDLPGTPSLDVNSLLVLLRSI
jgi:hypothetical protein